MFVRSFHAYSPVRDEDWIGSTAGSSLDTPAVVLRLHVASAYVPWRGSAESCERRAHSLRHDAHENVQPLRERSAWRSAMHVVRTERRERKHAWEVDAGHGGLVPSLAWHEGVGVDGAPDLYSCMLLSVHWGSVSTERSGVLVLHCMLTCCFVR